MTEPEVDSLLDGVFLNRPDGSWCRATGPARVESGAAAAGRRAAAACCASVPGAQVRSCSSVCSYRWPGNVSSGSASNACSTIPRAIRVSIRRYLNSIARYWPDISNRLKFMPNITVITWFQTNTRVITCSKQFNHRQLSGISRIQQQFYCLPCLKERSYFYSKVPSKGIPTMGSFDTTWTYFRPHLQNCYGIECDEIMLYCRS